MSAVGGPKSVLDFMKIENAIAKIKKKHGNNKATVVAARAMAYKVSKTEKGERVPMKVNEPVARSFANSPEPPDPKKG